MAYDLARLSSYVRFYLTVVKQLGSAWENLGRVHVAARDTLAPFAEPLAPLESPLLQAALAEPNKGGEVMNALFKPTDEEGLTGLNDIYEVVGRFSFQGDENENLQRVQALVSGARNQIVAERMRLADLARIADLARASAARIDAEEAQKSAAERAERLAAFEPLAEQVAVRARQTLDAVKSVPLPDVSKAETCGEEYRRYAQKVDQVYQTCLPFLRKAIAALYASIQCEPSASWPDSLPITPELPAELVAPPPSDHAELAQARASLAALGEEEIQLARLRDDVATAMARLEGELGAAALKDRELEVEIARAGQIIELTTALEQTQATRRSIADLEAQRTVRLRESGEVLSRHKQTEAGIKMLEEELQGRTREIGATSEQLAAEKNDEPVLFGKDDWRVRVAGLESTIDQLRTAYGQRLSTLNRLKIDLSALSVQVQTEQQQTAVVDRQLAEQGAALEALQKSLRDMTQQLGANRPARPLSIAEAHQAHDAFVGARVEASQRSERLQAEVRRNKEETARIVARSKQIGVERQQVSAMLQSAQVAATQGREEAMRHLGLQRRAAVERHVGEVLGTLEKSLTMVGPVFIEPARDVMMKATERRPGVAAAVLDAAEKVGPVVEKLARELEPELLAQDAALGQIQREFCDVALSACRAAWG